MVFKYEDTIRLKVKEWEIFRPSQSQVIAIKNDKHAYFQQKNRNCKKKQMKNSEMKATSEIKSLYRLCISIN